MMSKIGRVHGSILALISPGKKPCFSSSTPTAGRVTMSLDTCPERRARTAATTASMVLPVPAGPVAKTILMSSFFNRSM